MTSKSLIRHLLRSLTHKTYLGPTLSVSRIRSQKGQPRVTNKGGFEETPKEYTSHVAMSIAIEGLETRSPVCTEKQYLLVHDQKEVHKFTGYNMYRALCLLNPSSFARTPHHIAVANWSMDSNGSLALVTTISTLTRTGSGKSPTTSMRELQRQIRLKKIKPVKDNLRTERFFSCLSTLHCYYYMQGRMYPAIGDFLRSLGFMLIASMLQAGKCKAPAVVDFYTGVTSLINGDQNPWKQVFRKLPAEVLVSLIRSRRIVFSDDCESHKIATSAIERWTRPPPVWSDLAVQAQQRICEQIRNWFETIDDEKIASIPLHSSSSTCFFSRSQGGGGTEKHMILGMYRLSEGKPSGLTNIWGTLPNKLQNEDFLEPAQTQEILDACSWFIDQISDLPQYVEVIFPPREPKSRAFVLFSYAVQALAKVPSQILRWFFRDYKESPYMRGLSMDQIQQSMDLARTLGKGLLSEDSSISTDSFDFDHSKLFFADIIPRCHPGCKKALDWVFSSKRVAVGNPTKPDLLAKFTAGAELFTGLEVEVAIAKPLQIPPGHYNKIKFSLNAVPDVLMRPHIARLFSIINDNSVTILKAPTGTGKTVSLAAATNAIISCASIVQLKMLSSSLTFFRIPHVVYYYEDKADLYEMKDKTVLCTSAFVISLSIKLPYHLPIFDEVEDPTETNVYGVFWAQRVRRRVLCMSATPEALAADARIFAPPLKSPYEVKTVKINFSQFEEKLLECVDADCGQILVVCFSHPQCRQFARQFNGIAIADIAKEALQDTLKEADLLFATNQVRSGITLPNLVYVFDLLVKYTDVAFPRHGFHALTRMMVSAAERKQLKGRVGRVGPGWYFEVQPPEDWGVSPHIDGVLTRPEFLARMKRYFNADELPLPINGAALQLECFHQQMLSHEYNVVPHPGVPFGIQILRAGLPNLPRMRCIIIRFQSFFDQGISSRMKGYARSPVAEDRKLTAELKNALTAGDPIRAIADFTQILAASGKMRNELELLSIWAEDYHQGEYEPYRPDGNLARLLALLNWRTIARCHEGQLQGVYRDFVFPHRGLEEGAYYILWGLGCFRGEINVDLILPLSVDVMAGTANTSSVHRTISEARTIQVPAGNLSRKVSLKLFHGRSAVTLDEKSGTERTFQPEELPGLLKVLRKTYLSRACSEFSQTICGCPMSSLFSVPVLQGTADSASAAAGVDAEVYGDDLIAPATDEEQKLVGFHRGSVGLYRKPAGTGFHNFGDFGFAVFCEQYGDMRTGTQVFTMKPRAVVAIAKARRPEDFMRESDYFLSDYSDMERVWNRYYPELYSRWEPVASPDLRVAVRKGLIRTRLMEFLNRKPFPGTQRMLEKSAHKPVLGYLESILLDRYPSTRGAPERVSRVEEQRPISGEMVCLLLHRSMAGVESRSRKRILRVVPYDHREGSEPFSYLQSWAETSDSD